MCQSSRRTGSSPEEDSQDHPNGQLDEPLLSPRREGSSSQQAEHDYRRANVTLALIYTFVYFSGRSIWNQSVLATFVYLIQHENAQAVGFITAIMGIAQLAASLPAGYMADVYRRDRVLAVASALGFAAIGSTVAASWWQDYRCLAVALALWGMFGGVANTSLLALFADSIPDGERSHYFTQRSILVTLANLAGPLSALAMFGILGNNWTAADCAKVMILGQLFSLPAIGMLCFFHDFDRSNNEDLEIEGSLEEQDVETADDAELSTPLLPDETAESNPAESDGESDDNVESDNENELAVVTHPTIPCGGCCLPPDRAIPILIAISDVIAGLGSGMSVRYFPLFFVDNLGLHPIEVQVVYALSNLTKVPLMRMAQRLAKRFGRCGVTIACKWAGLVFMAAMIAVYWWRPHWRYLISFLFVFRTSCMNSSGALTRSMLMDHVPSDERGKWSALESINMFSWSGSAALGGVLVGILGLVPIFMVTACMQFASTLIILALVGVDTQESNLRTRASRLRN